MAAATTCPDVSNTPSKKRPVLGRTRAWRALFLAAALVMLTPVAASCAPFASERDEDAPSRVATTVLEVPAGMNPAEPHLAVDPDDPERLFAVAQVGPEFTRQEFLWRTDDSGKTWTRSPLLGGSDNSATGVGFDPVVAVGGHDVVLYGTVTADLDAAAGTATNRVGTRISTDGGVSFTGFGSADEAVLPLCFFDGSCPPPAGARLLDKPWLAIDATAGAFGGAYLVWVRRPRDPGQHELLVSVSKDQGRTYAAPILLDTSSEAELAELEELAQLTVRPDGTVDVVWNGVRDGQPLILHAWSTDGGASFSAPEQVVQLDPAASRTGVVTSLAASPRGRLAVCWSQARSPNGDEPRVACTITAGRSGGWEPAQEILPQNRDRQYLPAATFQSEQLWVTAYVSSATSTQLVAVRGEGIDSGPPITVNRWPIPNERICAPAPPACLETQTFIGDYIGLVATQRHIVVAYIQPSADPSEVNRVLVSSF